MKERNSAPLVREVHAGEHLLDLMAFELIFHFELKQKKQQRTCFRPKKCSICWGAFTVRVARRQSWITELLHEEAYLKSHLVRLDKEDRLDFIKMLNPAPELDMKKLQAS